MPSKNLAELVRAGTFRARTQHALLATSDDLPWEALRLLQQRYRAAAETEQRRAIAREFERLVREAHEEAQREEEGAGCSCPGCVVGLEPMTLEHFRAWAAGVTLDTGDPWVLQRFQELFISDLFSGYVECWLVVPEGNTKTTTLGGIALYHCEHIARAWVPVAASSREQAEIMYRQAEGMVLRTQRLRAVFRTLEGYRRIRCDQMGSRIQVFAADDRTGDGVIPTLALVDELHRHRDLKLYRTWRGKLEKRGGQIATISTAGEPGTEFEETRERIRQLAANVQRDGTFVRAEADGIVLHEYAVPEGADVTDIDIVKAANPFSGVTPEGLRLKFASPTMTMGHWRRFVCNLPTRDNRSAIQEVEWYDAETSAAIPPGEPIWLGLDVGWKWDTTAAVPLWWRDKTFRLIGKPAVLEPPRDGTSLDPHLVERALVQIHERNPIHTVVMDMTKAEQLASWIEVEFGATVAEFPQKANMKAKAYESFMEALRNGWLKHTGDRVLREHVLNAIARVLPYGDACFDRPSETRQGGEQRRRVIDALDAASMVHYVAASAKPVPLRTVASW